MILLHPVERTLLIIGHCGASMQYIYSYTLAIIIVNFIYCKFIYYMKWNCILCIYFNYCKFVILFTTLAIIIVTLLSLNRFTRLKSFYVRISAATIYIEISYVTFHESLCHNMNVCHDMKLALPKKISPQISLMKCVYMINTPAITYAVKSCISVFVIIKYNIDVVIFVYIISRYNYMS